MTLEPGNALRLQFLVRVVRKECQHLNTTDQRLFRSLFTIEQAALLEKDPDLAERVVTNLFFLASSGCCELHLDAVASRHQIR